MKHGHRFLMVALVVGALALLAAGGEGALAAQGTIIYVDADARGRDDGTTWRNAYTDLQDALEEAEPMQQIWVAAGTYKPSHEFIPDDPRSASFQMVNGVALYGGFKPGLGVTKFDERDWVAYETITSGNIGDEDRFDDNSYHVWYNPLDVALDGTAILDGFVIADGNADQEDPSGLTECGGGMVNEGSSPALRNITFMNNSAGYGGALWVSAPYPEEVTVTLTNVSFVSNLATEGGAVLIEGAETIPWVIGHIVFANCIFRSNVAERGGAVAIALGEPDADLPPIRFTNCTIYGNEAELGGAFYVGKGPGEGWLAVTNSILWDDTADEIYLEDGVGLPLVTYSDIEGGYEGDTNIDLDPRFVDPSAGDLHLQPGSPCIDAGYNDAPNLPTDDFEGDPRLGDGDGDGYAVVDMGVYEYYPWIWVEISVTPYIPTNVIRLRPGVVVDVAILSTEEFDAVAEVAADTVLFGGATHVGFDYVDVNEDDLVDVLLDFRTEDMVDLNTGSTEATLTGLTQDDVPFEGTAEVKVR